MAGGYVVDHPLAGAQEKLRRAAAHLNALEAESNAFLVTNPCTISIEPHVEGGYHRLVAHLPAEAFPLSLSGILGDYVHNVRSALDHVVWQLVGAVNPRAQSRKTCFPIYTDPDDFERWVTKKRAAGQASALLGVDDQAYTLIERIQPFQPDDTGEPRASAHALKVLADLSNTDKHKMLIPTGVDLPKEPPKIGGVGFEHFTMTWHPGPVEDGAEVGRLRVFGSVDGGAHVKVKGNIDLAFGESRVPGAKLKLLALQVNEIVRGFWQWWSEDPSA